VFIVNNNLYYGYGYGLAFGYGLWNIHIITMCAVCYYLIVTVALTDEADAARGSDAERCDVASSSMMLDGQTDSVKKNRIRLTVVNPSAIAGSEQRSTARQIQSKRTEFVCPSSTGPRSLEHSSIIHPPRELKIEPCSHR
jgi:hypothetical protein